MNNMSRHSLVSSDTLLPYWLMALVITTLAYIPASGLTRIRDIARPLGERTNRLIGTGLVVGLAGTGDSDDSLATNRPLASLLQNLGAVIRPEELVSNNVALVSISVTLGRNGVREGDPIDAQVASIGDASSLAGGRLIIGPLQSFNRADDSLLGWAEGPVAIPDKNYPTVGVVKGGAVLEIDFLHEYVHFDEMGSASFTLILDDDIADWQTARTVAIIIDDEMTPPGAIVAASSGAPNGAATIAEILGPRNIKVHIGPKQARSINDSSLFIARVLDLQIDVPDPEAAVMVKESTGTIVVTGNVEISPVLISLPSLVIRIGNPAPQDPQGTFAETQWGKFDTSDVAGSKLDNLLQALDQLKVPAQEKINALYEIQRVGALRARLITE